MWNLKYLEMVEHRMGGRKIIENEIGKEFREPAVKGFMSYAEEHGIYPIGYWTPLRRFSSRKY